MKIDAFGIALGAVQLVPSNAAYQTAYGEDWPVQVRYRSPLQAARPTVELMWARAEGTFACAVQLVPLNAAYQMVTGVDWPCHATYRSPL